MASNVVAHSESHSHEFDGRVSIDHVEKDIQLVINKDGPTR